MFRSLIAVGVFGIAIPAVAAPVGVSGEVLRESVPGSTIEVNSPLGALPIHHREDGRLYGEARGLAFFLGASTDTGRWWIADDRLCHKWTKWFDAETHCLTLAQDGTRVFWRRDDGKTGTATITAQGKVPVLASEDRFSLGAPLNQEAAPQSPPTPSVAAVDTAASSPTAPAIQRVRPPRADVALPLPNPARRGAQQLSPEKPKAVAAQVAAVSRQPAAPVAPSAATASYRVAGVASDDVLNVRAGPSPTHPIVGAIPPQGSDVRVVGTCHGAWCPIVFRSTRGWVSSYYLANDE